MNNYISDWNFEADLPTAGQKNPTGADHDLVELLWRNGQVVLHSQTHRKQGLNVNIPITNELPSRQSLVHNNQTPIINNNNNNMGQEDETVSWIHYPIEDSFEKEFCSNFFSELPSPQAAAAEERGDHNRQMAPPDRATVGLSHCGSNQVARPGSFGGAHPAGKAGLEPTATATSSSGGSGSSFGRACKQCTTTTTSGNTNNNNKRKNRETDQDLECQSEAVELDSATANKSAMRSGNSRKSRAAEVHNLSERRRRDRINEKMKALQELIPHSNKTDKASMLDEAIEYLKSLQLQLQVMWMGSGMTPMMFPGVQHYMSRMGMAMGPQAISGPMHLPPRAPQAAIDHHHQPMIVAAPTTTTEHHQMMCHQAQAQAQAQAAVAFNTLGYTAHPMQTASFPDQYARFMGFHPMQTVSQPMNVNVFRFNHPQAVQPQQQQQQSHFISQQGFSNGPSSGGATIDGGLSGKNMG